MKLNYIISVFGLNEEKKLNLFYFFDEWNTPRWRGKDSSALNKQTINSMKLN